MADTNLIFFDSTIPSSVLLKNEYYYKCNKAGATLTLKDVTGVATATLGTYIGNLTAIYTEIMIACPCESTSQSTANGTINLTNQAALRLKLISASQGTLTAESAVADTYSATTLGNTAMAVANALVGTPDSPIYILTTAGTGSGQLSTIKSNTVDAATIYGTFYAVPNGTTKYKIVTGSKLFVVGQAQAQSATVTKTRAELGWAALYPGITLPVINSYYAGVPGYALYTGTMTSACGDKTLTDSALGASTNQYAGYYAVIYNASTFGYQYGKIASNTATVLTLTANWPDTKGTGTGGVWRLYARERDCMRDIYLNLWLMTNLTVANSNSTQLAYLARLIDNNGKLADGTAVHQTLQDLDFLENTVLADGAKYLTFIKGGFTNALPV